MLCVQSRYLHPQYRPTGHLFAQHNFLSSFASPDMVSSIIALMTMFVLVALFPVLNVSARPVLLSTHFDVGGGHVSCATKDYEGICLNDCGKKEPSCISNGVPKGEVGKCHHTTPKGLFCCCAPVIELDLDEDDSPVSVNILTQQDTFSRDKDGVTSENSQIGNALGMCSIERDRVKLSKVISLVRIDLELRGIL